MRDEIKRISKLVAEGKLSPEDAADLIDAFYESERADRPEASGEEAGTPPPPPGASKDPFKALIEGIEKLTKEGVESVNWQEVSRQAKDSAKKGFEALRTGIEDLSKGKVNIGWISAQESREITLPLAVPEGKTLKIENAVGNVRVVGGAEAGYVTAHARIRGSNNEDARAKADEYTLIVEESDHGVAVKQPDVSGLFVDLEIKVVGSPMVEIRAASGDLAVLDVGGGCRATSTAGTIHVRGANGLIELNANSGDVTVEDSESPSLQVENKSGDISLVRVKGNLNARTATGDVTLDHCSGKVFSVESVSGEVRADIDIPVVGSVNVRTVNGNATVSIPDGSDCRVSLSTLRGLASCTLELTDEARADQRITGRLGDGSGSLDVSAVTGNISLEQRDAAT